ncbi:MAG TPA: class I SAM-dependent methyltransferase [Pseudonocardiaceae bacterium]|nr:class I SAM-dependent methyltransferase [Pseudonocardiaceae bacterium]
MNDRADEFTRRASSFGSQAAAYAEFRPDYPAALLEWGLSTVRSADDLRVLDLAAGTGKLTEGLLKQNVDVVAVEPDAAMLAELTSRFPGVTTLTGTAEAIPLPDAAVNAVFVGQALHWFDLARALPEIGRVLRPGGCLVAAWNTYDDRVRWLAELGAINGVARSRQAPARETMLAAFGLNEEKSFPHRIIRTVDTFLANEATQSQMLISTPERRAAKLAQMRALLLANPETATGDAFTVPITTYGLRITPR